jgi:hypothetical protein
MNMRSTLTTAGLALTALVLAATGAEAATNVALSSDGAFFVDASSYNTYATTGCGAVFCGSTVNGGLPTMQSNVITNAPTPWLSDGDTRYIFANGDQNQWIEIDLGAVRSLSSFGVTFVPYDRAVVGPFYVEAYVNNTWTQEGAAVVAPASGADLITLSTPVAAQHLRYFFGPTTSQYGGDGSGVSQVFANAVPEPSTWAMMLLGVGGLGAMLRRQRRAACAA